MTHEQEVKQKAETLAARRSATIERLRAGLEGLAFTEVETRDHIATLEVERGRAREVLARLKGNLGFEQATFVTCVDHFPAEPRFRVLWQLRSAAHSDRVRVQCRVPEEDAVVPTVVDLWPGARFMERETWDLFGVRFEGHEDLRRLMMPEGYDYHPLRKDFPHQGIEPDRLYREWDRNRRIQGARSATS